MYLIKTIPTLKTPITNYKRKSKTSNMKPSTKPTSTLFLLALLLVTPSTLSASTKDQGIDFSGGIPGVPANGYFWPGGGFRMPDFGAGWPGSGGFGWGYGGPSGGDSKGVIIRPTVVCKERGPCYMKKLTCPAKCFTSFQRSGKGFGAGGGGGGCTMDCNNKCIAYC